VQLLLGQESNQGFMLPACTLWGRYLASQTMQRSVTCTSLTC
jgi:hypothetical protein